MDSDREEEVIEKEDSDSDDDLLAPTTFLQEKRELNILTPRRGQAPAQEEMSPLMSPLSPMMKVAPVQEKRARFSLTSLLNEKGKADMVQRTEEKIETLKTEIDCKLTCSYILS